MAAGEICTFMEIPFPKIKRSHFAISFAPQYQAPSANDRPRICHKNYTEVHYGSTTFWGVALIMAFPFSRQIGDFTLLSTSAVAEPSTFCPFSVGDSR